MQAIPIQIWKGGMNLGWDHNGAPVQMSRPLTTGQMNINPCTSMAPRRAAGTDGYNRMDSTATAWVSPASIPTPYFPASTVGPKELAYYGGRIPALSPPPSEDHGGIRRVHQQQRQKPHVRATHNLPPLIKSHYQHLWSQKGQSGREVCEWSKSAQKNCRLTGSLAGDEDNGPDSQCGRRLQETAFAVVKRYQPLHSFGPSECRSSVPAESTSSASQLMSTHSQDPSSVGKEHCSHKLPSHTPCPAPQPAHLKLKAMSKNKRFTDAYIHDFLMERVSNIMAGRTQSGESKGAERTHCLSSSTLNVCLPSKENTGSLHLKMDESAPRHVTSTASSEEICLSSTWSAGSQSLDCNGNEKWSTAFGKGIPEKHAELTRNVLKQDGHSEPKPEKDSTEYPKIMMLAAEVCAKNDNENPVILSALSGTTPKEFIEQRAASEVGNSATQGRYTSSWIIANCLEDRDKEPDARHPVSYVDHPEARETGTLSLADNWQAGKTNTEMDMAKSIQMSCKEEHWFESQHYEDISEDDIQNGEDVALDLQSNRLTSETTIGNLSGASSKDCPVYKDICQTEISTDASLIIDEPSITQLSNNVKQPIKSGSPTNVPALSKHLFNSARQSRDGTSNSDKTPRSTEKDLCIRGGKNSPNNKGPGLIPGLLPEVHAARSLQQQVIYISSDEDPMDLSTEEDGSTDTEIQENVTEAISPMIEEEDAEEDWLMIPVAITYLAFVEANGNHVSQAKNKSSGENILPSTTQKPLPTSPMRQLEVFDTHDSFQAKACPNPCSDEDSQIIIVSDDELPVPTPTEGNLIPAEPSNGNIVRRCRKRSSSCDTEDSSDYSSSESSSNYLTVSPQCWEDGNLSKFLKKRKTCEKFHSAKRHRTITFSDSKADGCVWEVEASVETDESMTPDPKSSPIESEDDRSSVVFKKATTKYRAKTDQTAILKGLKKLTAEGTKIKHRGAKGLSLSDSEDSGDNFPVLQIGHLAEGHRYPVKGPQQRAFLDLEIAQKPPCVAGAEERVSTSRELPKPNPIIPRLTFQMPSEQSDPVTLAELTIPKNKRDDSRLSRRTKKNNPVTSANGQPRNKTRDEKLRSEKRKMLNGTNGEQKVNAFNTGQLVTSSKPTSVSKDHLIIPKQLATSTAALQKYKGHSTASTEPPRTASSGGKEPPRTASSGGKEPPRTASSGGKEPPRTASSGDHNNQSTWETSCHSTHTKKRISHYCRSADKTKDFIHQKLSCLTETAPSSSKGQSNSSMSSKSSKTGRHSIDSKRVPFSDASGSTKESARQQIRKEWKDSFVSPRISRRHSSGPEDTRRHASSSSKNADMSEEHDAGKDAELEPCPNAAQQKKSCYTASATLLMKRTKNQAMRLTQAKHVHEGHQERRHSVGEGCKWFQNQKSSKFSRKPRPSSPSEVEQLSQW